MVKLIVDSPLTLHYAESPRHTHASLALSHFGLLRTGPSYDRHLLAYAETSDISAFEKLGTNPLASSKNPKTNSQNP